MTKKIHAGPVQKSKWTTLLDWRIAAVWVLGFLGCAITICAGAQPVTFCNPMDLDYRFQLDEPTRREAADPAVVLYRGEYWLFASKSGGYWHSPDFIHWVFVDGKNLPIEDYAPAPAVINGRLYYTAAGSQAIFRADDPWAGTWTKVGDLKSYGDPDLFQDDDGRVYMYYGCSPNGGIRVDELDPANGFKEIGKPVICLWCDRAHRGWEMPGDENNGTGDTWVEGAWMTKHDGKYYLQYAAPGTQYHSYADGIFVGETPKGPFTYAPYSPFSQKPTGFITGAGHSGTFQDKRGNWWRVVTMVISVRHIFERRIGVFPVGFCDDGQMFCNTWLGDYPEYVPGTENVSPTDNSAGWMLLSRGKKAEASSELPNYPVTNAFDENIQTWWSANTGNAGEWLKVDLGKTCRINALQINFADQGAHYHGKLRDDAYQYYVEASRDGIHWEKILDRSNNHRDAPQDYAQLANPVKERYLRLVNIHCPAQACFSISDFRVFGNGPGRSPAPVKEVTAQRNPDDGRKAVVSWTPAKRAEFYIVRYGLAPDRLFNNYQVYNATNVEINALNSDVRYYFTVDAVNDSGVTRTRTSAMSAVSANNARATQIQ
ncbi:MAG TPA: family 43 glycosylhydrolase [Candidatus Sulfotelmatobacter sp.]|nr:family 43 glycosylhydrolase [Candidatus Sulfotelmatobacter sp.]